MLAESEAKRNRHLAELESIRVSREQVEAQLAAAQAKLAQTQAALAQVCGLPLRMRAASRACRDSTVDRSHSLNSTAKRLHTRCEAYKHACVG